MNTDIFQRLREDHGRVLRQLDDLQRANAAPSSVDHVARVRDVVAMLERQFATHMAAEDDVLLPALARSLESGAALVAPFHDEHAELQLMLTALAGTLREAPGLERDEQISVQVRDLSDLLRIHIRKEEALLFGVAERVLSPQERAALVARSTPEPRRGAPDHPNTGSKGTCT